MKIKEISFGDIHNVFVSGGFSSKINISSTVETGLLPEELADKVIPINNSSLLGSIKYATENNDLSNIVGMAEYVDLSLNNSFSDLFIENMMF